MKPEKQIQVNLGTIDYLQNCCQDLLLNSFETFFNSRVKKKIDLENFDRMFEDPDGGENEMLVLLNVKSIAKEDAAIFVELEGMEEDVLVYEIADFTFEEQKELLEYLINNC